MSVTTTCDFYWVDNLSSVVEFQSQLNAQCDSDNTKCSLKSIKGSGQNVTCDSTLQFPEHPDNYYFEYFCVCGNTQLKVPQGVDCDSRCYHLTTDFPTCNLLYLDNGFTKGSSINRVANDTCGSYKCDSEGVNCSQDGPLRVCDNAEHVAKNSTIPNYVCNCKGPAIIPEMYRSKGGPSTGESCASASLTATPAATTPSSALATTSTGSSASTTSASAQPATTSGGSGSNAGISVAKSAPLASVLFVSIMASLLLRA